MKSINVLKDKAVLSNILINKTAQNLTTVQIKLLLLAISKIEKDDGIDTDYTFSVSEIAKALGRKELGNREAIYNAAHKLVKSTVEFQSKDAHGVYNHFCTWMSCVTIPPFSGQITFEFSPRLKPFLIELKEQFTVIPIEQVLKLTSANNIKLYKLIKQWEHSSNKNVTFTIEELKSLLGIQDKYPEFGMFKSQVLEPAKRQINDMTDINIEYTLGKTSRRYTHITFSVESDKKKIRRLNRMRKANL